MQKSLEQFYKENYRAFVKKFTRSSGTIWNAEDIVQTAFERAIRYNRAFDSDEEFHKWFNIVLRNCLIDKLNEERGIIFEELDEFEWESPLGVDTNMLQSTVENMLKEENPDHQPILELHFLKGYKAKEIYQFNSITYPNTRKIIQRFRDKVQKKLNESD